MLVVLLLLELVVVVVVVVQVQVLVAGWMMLMGVRRSVYVARHFFLNQILRYACGVISGEKCTSPWCSLQISHCTTVQRVRQRKSNIF